ncbi:hypothetical protein GCM10023262_08110 [Bartonella pachyuromydis]|uniref:Uncharacterized protein n=1 Tax=Bartonella pachyuromydis TaxID=931097 RepID=A0ABP8VFT9_9HYPH
MRLYHRIPLYFLLLDYSINYNGIQPLKKILNSLNYGVYVFPFKFVEKVQLSIYQSMLNIEVNLYRIK